MRGARIKTVWAAALGISRKNIYRRLKQPLKDEALKQAIEVVHREHPAYGHRRVAIHLNINHKRAQRVMAKFNLRPPRRRIRHSSTVSTSHHPYTNLLKQTRVSAQQRVWCSDLSRLVYRGSVWYLATIEDRTTRQILAARLGKRHNSQLVLATLQQALASRQPPAIFHSDQGTEFMARACTDYLEQQSIRISVSDVASPWQNGFVESFFGRFKHELGDLNRFDTAGEMIEAVYRHLHYYNHRRIHTALRMPPAAYVAQHFSDNCLHFLGT